MIQHHNINDGEDHTEGERMTDKKRKELVGAVDEADQAWDEACQAWDEAKQAWDEADQAWNEAEQAWVEACQAVGEYDANAS